ncbi:MAG: carboxypeptidase-like regulatory domain-containing protein, partial [Gemmatimonadota bacterium]|nr:carboxypeptidase-like regulatory domain-containing protein [Gemmatimonadota bacterium]
MQALKDALARSVGDLHRCFRAPSPAAAGLRRVSRAPGWLTAAVLLAVPGSPASAQAGTETPARFVLRGEVRDFSTELPIDGAVVQVAELGISQLTDANGYFEFGDLPAGAYTFITASFGYETNEERSEVGPGNIMLIRLNPMAIEIAGVTVEAERLLQQLETRRIMAASPVTVFDQGQLSAGLPSNLTRIVMQRAPSMGIFTSQDDQLCVTLPAASQPVRLRVFLDEAPVATAFLENLQSA